MPSKRQHNTSDNSSSYRYATLVTSAVVLITLYTINQQSVYADSNANSKQWSKSDPDLPVYTSADVKKHGRKASRIWVTYSGYVYDITDFIALHPGGNSKILLAAGTDTAPFWNIYQQHKKKEVQDILAQYLIGKLDAASSTDTTTASQPVSDPYINQPERNPALITLTDKPCNAETPNDLLQSRITPNELFYVRNHMHTPPVDPSTYKLTITGDHIRTTQLTLDEIKTKFKRHSVEVTLQCAGNRRHEMNVIKPIKGLDWECGAISNAIWSGAKLRDILEYTGLDVDGVDQNTVNSNVAHIQMEGLDIDPITQTGYGSSIPVSKAVSNTDDVIVAYEMNGVDIPPDHGYPIRVVVPGIVGARSVKWCHKIIASPYESSAHWQQYDYKSFNNSIDWNNVDWSSSPAIQETPITSAITSPSNNDKLSIYDDEVNIQGYAYSGGGRDVIRVDVSIDDGKTWSAAKLHKTNADMYKRHTWNWVQWSSTLPVELKNHDNVNIICKAVDSQYNSQPDNVQPIWNLRGVLNNAWHRVNIKVDQDNVDSHATSSPDK